MIVRMWEGRLAPQSGAAFRALLDAALPAVRAVEGCQSVEVFASTSQADGERVVIISRWVDSTAIAQAAGLEWQTASVVIPGEEELWARPPHVWHFEQWAGPWDR